MSSSLRIHVDNPRSFYCPGDVVTGQVVLTTTTDRAIGQVNVKLLGRAKTKIIRNHGQSESHLRGRAVFFDIPQTLFTDHHTHKPGTFSWPFSFVIPLHPQHGQASHKWKPRDGFLSNQENMSSHPLPPTFYFRYWGFGRRFRAFTEYSLQTTVIDPAGAHILIPGRTEKATEKLRFHSTPGPLVTDFKLTLHKRESSVKTLKLLPEHADTELTFKQKTVSFFKSSSLPRYGFTLEVTAPKVIQLNHPDTIPFYISLVPLSNSEKTTIESPYPEVLLRSFSLTVKARTQARAAFFFTDSTMYAGREVPICNFMALKHSIPVSIPTAISIFSPNMDGEKMDLGAQYDLRMHEGGSLTPSFSTYNISHTHTLEWKVEMECAGEKVKMDGANRLTVLGAPEGVLGDITGQFEDMAFSDGEEDDDDDESKDNEKRTAFPPDDGDGNGGKAAEARRESSGRRSRTTEESLPQYEL